MDKTESFRLINSNITNNISVDLFVTHPKFNTVSLAVSKHENPTRLISYSLMCALYEYCTGLIFLLHQ